MEMKAGKSMGGTKQNTEAEKRAGYHRTFDRHARYPNSE